MGNSLCCPKSNPCDYTVDETQGLLNSPDSKVSAKPLTTDGISQALETEDSKNEADCIRHKQEQNVVTTQPTAASKSAEEPAQSSYCSVIQSLHTEVSLAAQACQSASPVSEMTEERVDAAATVTETKREDEPTKETNTSATDSLEVKASTELATAEVKEETEAHTSEILRKEEKPDEPMSIIQDATEEVPADELHGAQVDTQNIVAEEDMEKRPVEADKNEDSAEMNEMKEVAEVDTEKEELETQVEVLPVVDVLQTEEPVLNNSVINEVKVKGLQTPIDTEEKSAETLLAKNSSAEPPVSEPSCEAEITALAIEKSVADELLENHEEHVVSDIAVMTEDSSPAKSQETLQQESTPTVNDGSTVNYIENGQDDDLTGGDLKDENPADVNEDEPQLNERLEKPCEEPLHDENQELVCEPAATNTSESSAEEVEKPKSTETAEGQKTITEMIKNEGDGGEEAFQNGLHTCAPAEKLEPTEKPVEQDIENEPKLMATGPSEAFSLDHDPTEEMEPAPEARENDETTTVDEKENEESNLAQKGEIIISSSHDVKVALIPVSDIENIAEKETEHEDNEDLYRGYDEIKEQQAKETNLKPIMEFTIPGVEEKCSLADPVDILAYSEREWKGNTAKSNLIRKGYSEISCSFTGLRRVRGDNYCSLRATLYQVLTSTTQTPAWLLEEGFTSLPERIEAEEHLIGMWVFPPKCINTGEKEDPVEKLKHYLKLLQKTWQEAAESETPEKRQDVCDHVFQGGEEEYALLEVLKFLMLVKAVELHRQMQAEQEVPVFCWLLFARDTSENPEMFFSNHLSQVGFSGGLEQVEMFLLGYALQHTIQAFRLYKSDTEEFLTHYPDDHKHDWPCVSVITEDDRHYNVPVRKPAQYKV